MAKRIVHQLVDDLDNSLLESGEGETVLFSLDGSSYEIDLTDKHAEELRTALAKYVSVARPVRSSGNGRKRRGSGPTNSRDIGAVRVWARENGYEVSNRGRIPFQILEAYDAAH